MKALVSSWVAIFLTAGLMLDAFAAPADAPVIRVDGAIPTGSPVTRAEQASISMSTTFSDGSIFYTLDGSAPSGASTRYTAPFTITSTKTIRAIAFSLDFSQNAEADPLEVRIVPYVTLALTHPAGVIAADPPPTDGKYMQGTTVRLTATGFAGWTFMNWEFDAAGDQNPIDILMDRDKSIRAVFGSPINILEPENGEIHTAPAITSGAAYRNYTEVRVTAVPDPGYHLVTWGGALVGADTPVTYFHNQANASISALFEPVPDGKVTLTATHDVGGNVSIYSYRKNGGPTNLYDQGTFMSLIARPLGGYAFTGWTGDFTGLQNPITLKLDSSKRVHARFELGKSLSIVSTDGGTVTRAPDALAYPFKAEIELTAVPAPGFTFAGWSGAITSDANPVTIILDNNFTVNARFVAAPWTPLWTYAVGGRVLADNGNVYIGGLHSLTPDGELRWQRESPGSASAVDPQHNVRVTHTSVDFINPDLVRSYIYTFDPTGQAGGQIEFGTSLNALSISHNGDLLPVLTINGRLGFAGHLLQARNPGLKWAFSVIAWQGGLFGDILYESLTRPAIALDQSIYLGGYFTTNSIYTLSPDGVQIGRREIEFGNVPDSTVPGVLDYNNVTHTVQPVVVLGRLGGYVIEGDGSLLAFDWDGNMRWRFTAGDVLSTPSIGADGALYMGARNSGRLYAINPDGSLRWTTTPALSPCSIPAVGADGTIYVASDKSLIAVDANGRKFKEFTASEPLRAPIIDGDRLYVSSATALHAFVVPGGAADSPWPMVNANPQHSAAVRESTFIEPPRFLEATVTETGLQFVVQGAPGSTIRIYRTSNFVDWTLHHTETSLTGMVTINYPPTEDHQFFVVSQE